MKQEEDFYANLAGEEGDTEETKRRWFRRIKKGITTSTKDKKKRLMAYGQNVLPAGIPAQLQN